MFCLFVFYQEKLPTASIRQSLATLSLWHSPLILLLPLWLYPSVTANNPRLQTEKWGDYNRILWSQQSMPFAVSHSGETKLVWDPTRLLLSGNNPDQAPTHWVHLRALQILPVTLCSRKSQGGQRLQAGRPWAIKRKVVQAVFRLRCLQPGIWYWVALHQAWLLLLTSFRAVSC